MHTIQNVKLVSSDGVVFEIEQEVADQSELLRTFLDKDLPFIESKERTFALPIRSTFLSRVIQFMEHKRKYNDAIIEASDFSVSDEEAMALLDVATYLKL
ncbi:elongin C [Binucleata daphniae]